MTARNRNKNRHVWVVRSRAYFQVLFLRPPVQVHAQGYAEFYTARRIQSARHYVRISILSSLTFLRPL